jgi:glycosyltransferase involved in cell wall biosynthesis
MPNWNKGLYIESAIRSVLDQNYRDFELIVVDGSSNDFSKSAIERLASYDGRVKPIFQESNEGIAAARNIGIRAAHSNLVTFVDSDDLVSPNRLRELVDLSRKSKTRSIVYSDVAEMDANASRFDSYPSSWLRPSGMILTEFLRLSHGDTNSITGLPNCGGSLTLPASCFDAVGYFDETLTYSEDLDMVLRLAARFPFIYNRIVSYGHRWHSQNSYYQLGRRERYRQKARVIEKNLFINLESLDSTTVSSAFLSLMSFELASRQYSMVVRHALHDWNAMRAVPMLARRVLETRIRSFW